MDGNKTIEESKSWRDWIKELGWELVALLILIVILTTIFLSMAESAIGNVFSEISIG